MPDYDPYLSLRVLVELAYFFVLLALLDCETSDF